jgi:hypothetical protein
MNPTDRVLLEIKTSRTGEETVDAMVQFLTSLTSMKRKVAGIFKKGIPISLEIAVVDQIVHFYVSVPVLYQAFVESQLLSQYPKALIAKSKDYLPDMLGTKIQGYKGAEEENSTNKRAVSVGMLKLTHPAIYPIRTAKEFKDVDPLSGVLSILSKSQPGDSACIQYLLVPAGSGWQSNGRSVANSKTTLSDGTSTANPYSALITEKISFPGFEVGMRILVSSETTERAKQYLSEIGGSFTSFIHPSGNGVVLKKPYSWQKTRLLTAMLHRNKRFVPRTQILNVQEIATLFHFPNMKLSTIQNLAWHKMILSDAPDTLPVAEGKTEEELLDINFFAKTEFKNKMTNFGVKTRDRMRHFYVIGKSGTGKSTFIANMAIDDLRKRRGFCVIDPHGDLCEHIMQFVPSYRVNDIAYMDPSDTEKSFAINPLEITHDSQKELVASSIVAIFKKLYGTSWGPRLEYILRNTIVSIIEMPDPTLLMVPEVLTNPAFRKKVIDTVKDPVVKSFWVNEFETMSDKLMVEATSSILNKVGQFTSSKTIRNIIGHPKSTVDIQKIMDEGKVLLLNLSQGYLGEDNAALLGAMIISKIQIAAMNRIAIKEEDRREFFLYVDEFQNFATTSFIKILSEARKFKLGLILANQYIDQVQEDIRAAIFGNAGTIMTFLVGANDAAYMAREFKERFKEEDILSLGNYQAMLKLCIDGTTSHPFFCYTLPLPNSKTQNREKVIKLSRERFGKTITE